MKLLRLARSRKRISTLAANAALLAAIAFVSIPTRVQATESDVSPRPTMQSVFAEMKRLIPLSLSEERWSDPAARADVLASLGRLEKAASALEIHGRKREAGFSELALNLAGDFAEARERYRLGAHEEARFFFTGSLQNCVACHVRPAHGSKLPLRRCADGERRRRIAPRLREGAPVGDRSGGSTKR